MTKVVDDVFLRQFSALTLKNWIVFSRRPIAKTLTCFLAPVAYGIFLAFARSFLYRSHNFGFGEPSSVANLADVFDGSRLLIWADGTQGTGDPSALSIISHITKEFNDKQLDAVKQVPSRNDIRTACPQNFLLSSGCFAAISFEALPKNGSARRSFNYSILADGGLTHIDVPQHASDYERRIMPIQWAVDSAIMDLETGFQAPRPLEWPFTIIDNKEQYTRLRLRYVRGIRKLLVLALFTCYIGIVYSLSGSFVSERAELLTAHMQVMGLRNYARILSWHLSFSAAYLPAWAVVACIWHFQIFRGTNIALILVVHILCGVSLASWSLFAAVPFGSSPQLAAVISTTIAIVFAVLAQAFTRATTATAFFFTLLFPPGFYIFAIRCIAGFEDHRLRTNALRGDPDNNLILLPIVISAIISTFLWPYIGTILESVIYATYTPETHTRLVSPRDVDNHSSEGEFPPPIASNPAISIRNLKRVFRPVWWDRKSELVAIEDLSLDIPEYGIFVLLGSNGAGKSTALSIMAGLQERTSGSITFNCVGARPGHGELGVVPQKNVLFPDLTCHQTLVVWRAIKTPPGRVTDEDLMQLLHDCDLGQKIHARASTLSGGQKRKLQLAIGLVGGSKILLVDECTSGLDPLSRRAIWRTLTSVRDQRTIVLTTHFLDEADLLADHIAVLRSPGKLVAQGTPVALKSTLGQGYTVSVTRKTLIPEVEPWSKILQLIHDLAPNAAMSSHSATSASYSLHTRDIRKVGKILAFLNRERTEFGISSLDVHATTLDDVFLSLMRTHSKDVDTILSSSSEVEGKSIFSSGTGLCRLTSGRTQAPISQGVTIFYKRCLIARRNWLTPLCALLIAVTGSCIPLLFIDGRETQTCSLTFNDSIIQPLYLPDSQIMSLAKDQSGSPFVRESPPGLLNAIGVTPSMVPIISVQDNATFVEDVRQNFTRLAVGGLSVNLSSGESLLAWQATPPGTFGLILLNAASNILLSQALNNSREVSRGAITIGANYQSFPGSDNLADIIKALRWTMFYGATLSVFPAFFTLYVAQERWSSVKAMQFSNGLRNPAELWLGHLMFDLIVVLTISSTIISIFAIVAGHQMSGLGFFWIVLVLYGIASALFAYSITLITPSPLTAFAASAGYQFVAFIIYVTGYLLTLTYAKPSATDRILTIVHFTLSCLAPIASPLRASFVSINLFSLLCDGHELPTTASLAGLTKYGGPIVYLCAYSLILLVVLIWIESSSHLTLRKSTAKSRGSVESIPLNVRSEACTAEDLHPPLLLSHVSKAYAGSASNAVNDVSFAVQKDSILALLGPNGAGKTTTFNMIRGELFPDSGDIKIQGKSVLRHPTVARSSLGVCPQFTAIDSHLTVREHLIVYGRLKGLRRGIELDENISTLLRATNLSQYVDRLASKLSGGNQRKLALAIALMGNPSVILIDEFSTGVDAKTKRDMWSTLKDAGSGKSVVMTTHSLEEASALADKVGILAHSMLAFGTTESLLAKHPHYEIHFSCRTHDENLNALKLMAHIPGARKADDVATRFEVPLSNDGSDGLTLTDLFDILATHGGDFQEYTIERASLESVFLKVIREHNIREEGSGNECRHKRWRFC